LRTDTAVLMSPDRVKMIGARRTRAAIIAHASFVASTSPARSRSGRKKACTSGSSGDGSGPNKADCGNQAPVLAVDEKNERYPLWTYGQDVFM
jgi:hypothetical protein